jgi:predicted aspartyl protease
MWGCLAPLFILCQVSQPAGISDAGREIPFDFLHNQIVVRGMLNGRGPYTFLLDTGTRASTVDARVAKELGLPVDAHASSQGVGTNRPTQKQTTHMELRFGPISIPRMDAAVFDLAAVSRTLGRPLHGVLGFGFLESRITRIDYFHRRIEFLTESPPRGEHKSISFPMQFRANSVLPVLEDCSVNGVRLALTIDTGSSMGLLLFPQAIERLGLDELARDGIPLRAGGYLGEARLTKGWVKSLVLKGIDLGAVEVAYVRSGYAVDESIERRGGSLGNAILQDFVLTLDYPNRLVTLESTVEP